MSIYYTTKIILMAIGITVLTCVCITIFAIQIRVCIFFKNFTRFLVNFVITVGLYNLRCVSLYWNGNYIYLWISGDDNEFLYICKDSTYGICWTHWCFIFICKYIKNIFYNIMFVTYSVLVLNL